MFAIWTTVSDPNWSCTTVRGDVYCRGSEIFPRSGSFRPCCTVMCHRYLCLGRSAYLLVMVGERPLHALACSYGTRKVEGRFPWDPAVRITRVRFESPMGMCPKCSTSVSRASEYQGSHGFEPRAFGMGGNGMPREKCARYPEIVALGDLRWITARGVCCDVMI